jgi:beta-lactamase regulating signal transducer with metallopeptidase domain
MTIWLIETMIAASVLMLAVLILRRPVLRHFGPRAAYLLWLAPALRMVLPVLPDGWASPALSGVQNVVVVLAGNSSQSLQSPAATGGGTVWLMVLAGLWLGGASLFFLQHLMSYWAFTRDIRADAELLFTQGRIRVARSHAVISPIAFGIFGKLIIVPGDFTHRFDETEQQLALAHESFHHRRGDMIVNIAALAILSLHWFNPLAHYAHRVFRLDQEAACDDLVLAGTTPAQRQAYGTALYKSATGGVPLVACAMGTASQLKARLQCIATGTQRPASLSAMGLMVALVFGGLAATASGMVVPPVSAGLHVPILVQNKATIAPIRVAIARPVTVRATAKPAQPAPVTRARLQPLPVQTFAPARPEQADPRLVNVNCSDGGSRAIFIHRASMSTGFQQGFAIILCDSPVGQQETLTNAVDTLRAERASESLLSDDQRDHVTATITLQIVQQTSAMEKNADTIPAI